MDGSTLLVYIGLCILSLYIFYLIIKAAVRNGIKEAQQDQLATTATGATEVSANEKQLAVQRRYDKGEITFDQYKELWDKSK